MARLSPVCVLLSILTISFISTNSFAASAGSEGYIEPTYNGINMSFVRMCAAFHCEACSPYTDPPGPCFRADDCLNIICDPTKPAGSCTADPSHTFCDNFDCTGVSRQQTSFLGRMSLRIAGKDVDDI